MLLVGRIREIDSEEEVWNRIESSIPLFRSKGVNPLYLTKRAEFPDTSIIASAPSTEIFFDNLLEVLKGIGSAESVWIFQLLKTRFFDVPENISKEATRYLMTISVKPADAVAVYEEISLFRQSADLALTYLAFTCQQHCDTITLSAFAKSPEQINRFIDQELKIIPGIEEVSMTPMSKSKRLLPYSDMVEILRKEVGNINIDRPMMDLSDFQ